MGIFAMASLLGDLTGSLCLCPSEVIKQKMQAGIFQTEREALGFIWKAKGILGFYEGYTGGLVRDIPFRVAQLVCTHELPGRSFGLMGMSNDISFPLSLPRVLHSLLSNKSNRRRSRP